jgi:hypothetical protein
MPIYWGDLHGHSDVSGGRRPPHEYFTYARRQAKLDFCALTDHVDHAPQSRNAKMSPDDWDHVKQATRAANHPGEFATLLGLERPVPACDVPAAGRMCILYAGDDGPVPFSRHEPRNWFRPGAVDPRAEMAELWDALKDVRRFTIVVHSGSAQQGFSWAKAPAEFAPDAVEVYSKWGCSEMLGAPYPITDTTGRPTPSGRTAHDALAAGFRLAFVGSSDTHFSCPGSMLWENDWGSSARYECSGLTAVEAEELTRDAIFEALKARRCYATTGERIGLAFTLAEQPMGSLVPRADGPMRLHVRVRGTAVIKRAEIFRNGEVIHRKVGGHEDLDLYFDDVPPTSGAWYTVRVAQLGESYAWSSPIWVTA